MHWLARLRRTPPKPSPPAAAASDPFLPAKRLCERDHLLLSMLNSQGNEDISYCITDPALDDNPVIYISGGFATLSGYAFKDIVGKNCRFLQGSATKAVDCHSIKEAIKAERDCNVNLLNYRKDGTVFINEFFLTTLRTPEKEVAYYIGTQAAVDKAGPGQMSSNPGWVLTRGCDGAARGDNAVGRSARIPRGKNARGKKWQMFARALPGARVSRGEGAGAQRQAESGGVHGQGRAPPRAA